MNETQVNTDIIEEKPGKGSEFLNSALLIITLTCIFGAVSFALIQLNNAVFQLSVSEGLWCGLAMTLAIGYYLFQSGKNNRTASEK